MSAPKLDREATLKRAEKQLRQGRLEGAINDYAAVVEAFPKDWATANMLGDLYVRAGLTDNAAAQYARIAAHFAAEGFFSKAAALYKKVLKIRPLDEVSQLQLAEVSARQGLLADAKSHLAAVAERRRSRGDKAGAYEVILRLGSLDPSDFDARRQAAVARLEWGDKTGAAQQYRALAADLAEKGREEESLDALREVVRCDPDDRDSRAQLARAALAAGDVDEARQFLSREVAGRDPALMVAVAEIDLRDGRVAEGLASIRELLAFDSEASARIVQLAWALCDTDPNAAFGCIEVLANRSAEAGEFAETAAWLQEFVTRVPRYIPALLRLIEVCVDGGLEAPMYAAQVQLADAYLDSGQALEASVIAEDLVAREPWETAHVDRFRRALVMLKTPNPDAVIAERLSGQSPFTATDPFSDITGSLLSPEPPAAGPELEDESGEELPAEAPPPQMPGSIPARGERDLAPPGPGISIEVPEETVFEVDLTNALEGLDDLGAALTGSESSGVDHPAPLRHDGPPVQAGEIQGEQFLTLARMHREAGRLDEAMTVLRTAVRFPRRRFEAASMLAGIHRERGEHALAVEWMERALEAQVPTPDDGRALLYTLGDTLESLGEVARALAVFLELQADAGSYRDVQARIDRLSRVQTGG